MYYKVDRKKIQIIKFNISTIKKQQSTLRQVKVISAFLFDLNRFTSTSDKSIHIHLLNSNNFHRINFPAQIFLGVFLQITDIFMHES